LKIKEGANAKLQKFLSIDSIIIIVIIVPSKIIKSRKVRRLKTILKDKKIDNKIAQGTKIENDPERRKDRQQNRASKKV